MSVDPNLRRISVQRLSKKFYPDLTGNSALAKFLSLFKKTKQAFQVLENISLEVNAGEIVGIIGRNGSGKSTLLRIIAEVYKPDEGSVCLDGKVIYLGGVGNGLIRKLSVSENIEMMGAVLGLSQKEMRAKANVILEFAGLHDFSDVKVYQLSSGMTTRLAFSVAIHCVKHHNPDILLLDEIFGGFGDIEFHTKSISKVNELVSDGAAIIMVSHQLKIVQEYCDRVLWIEKGKIVKEGNAADVVTKYKETYLKGALHVYGN